jgi:hypothetical protein
MQIGTSLFLIAAGAIARFAISDTIDGVDLGTIGTILMIVGVVGLVLSLLLLNRSGGAAVVEREREYRDPPA